MVDSAGVNQSYRAHILPRVVFHAADRANMLNSAGVDSAKVQNSAGIHPGRCKSMVHRASVPDSTGVNSAEGVCYG